MVSHGLFGNSIQVLFDVHHDTTLLKSLTMKWSKHSSNNKQFTVSPRYQRKLKKEPLLFSITIAACTELEIQTTNQRINTHYEIPIKTAGLKANLHYSQNWTVPRTTQ